MVGKNSPPRPPTGGMSAYDVLLRFGIWPLARFALALLAFVALYLVRVPFAFVASLLADGMEWANRYLTLGMPVRPAANSSAGGGR